MENKEGFLLYKGFWPPIERLSNDHLGLLFRAIYEYQITGKEPSTDSPIYMVFLFFKNQFQVDEKKYQKTVEANRQNGKKGGRPPKDHGDNGKKPDNQPDEETEKTQWDNSVNSKPIKADKGKGIDIDIEKENGKVDVIVKGEEETNSTSTLTIPDSFLNEFKEYKKEVVIEELSKFYALNEKNKTTWKDQQHIEKAFRGFMKNVKKDPDDYEASYYPVIKSKIPAISNQVKGISFDNRYLRFLFTKWSKETLDVIKYDQQAVVSYTAYVLPKMKALEKEVSPNGSLNRQMGFLTRDMLGIEDCKLSEILSQFKKNTIAESNGVPPIFNMNEYNLDFIREKIKEMNPGVELQKWEELTEKILQPPTAMPV